MVDAVLLFLFQNNLFTAVPSALLYSGFQSSLCGSQMHTLFLRHLHHTLLVSNLSGNLITDIPEALFDNFSPSLFVACGHHVRGIFETHKLLFRDFSNNKITVISHKFIEWAAHSNITFV
jgi:hypothetical protein